MQSTEIDESHLSILTVKVESVLLTKVAPFKVYVSVSGHFEGKFKVYYPPTMTSRG